MRAFVDTSALFKKYVNEPGSDEFEKILREVTDIAVSPLTWIEVHSVLARRVRDRILTREQGQWIKNEAQKDFRHFRHVRWTDALVQKSCELTHRMSLKTLDSIQLASGVLSIPDRFITADRQLFVEAKKILESVYLV